MSDRAVGFQPQDPPPERSTRSWLRALLVAVVLLTLVVLMLVPNFQNRHEKGQLIACNTKCKNLATALYMYAADNKGHYPGDLRALLSGNYLKTIPTCPAAGTDTYSQTYQLRTAPKVRDTFRFYCSGSNHGSSNFPQYDSDIGLIEHP